VNANWKGLAVRKVSIKLIRKTGWLHCTVQTQWFLPAIRLIETRTVRVINLFAVYCELSKLSTSTSTTKISADSRVFLRGGGGQEQGDHVGGVSVLTPT